MEVRSADMSPPWAPPACAQRGAGGKGSFEYWLDTDILLVDGHCSVDDDEEARR